MPIVGIIDPSHKQRRTNTGGMTGETPKWFPPEYLLSQAAHAEPKWSPWSYELLAAALAEQEDRGDHISSTALNTPCPRSMVLERKEDYVTTMDELWRAFRGTMVHKVLEDTARPGSVAEVRFFTEIAGEAVSCKPDLITPDGVIWDYKNVAEKPIYDYVKPYHAEQLQFNRYIVQNATHWEKDGEAVELPFNPNTLVWQHLAIMYMDLNGPKPLETQRSTKVTNKSNAGSHSVRVPDIWTDEQTLEVMVPRIKALREAFDAYPKFPKGVDEVWGGSPEWKCPGFPHCYLRGKCLASRYPDGLVW